MTAHERSLVAQACESVMAPKKNWKKEGERPLAVDLACGLGGWTDGLLAEGWQVVGFDIERHQYGEQRYPAQLVIQDILTLDGRQFRGKVALIVASPPCQFFSYTAMPWSRAKALAADVRADPVRLAKELALFNACVRIGREAECPIVIENVRGAIPWVGRSAWNYGSFHLWGNVPALMPVTTLRAMKGGYHLLHGTAAERRAVGSPGGWWTSDSTKNNGGSWFNVGSPGQKVTGQNPVHDGTKVASEQGRRTDVGNGVRFTSRDCGIENDGIKQGGDWFGPGENCSISRRSGSKSSARKAASARIAMIPLPLAQYIARVYKPHWIGSRLMEALELPRGKE